MLELENECREMVKRGFDKLTRAQRDQVDVGTLDMELGDSCVLGQIYGLFDTGLYQLFNTDEQEALSEAIEHGFYVPLSTPDYFTRYVMLTRIWRDMLETEREITDLLGPVGSF